MLITSREQLRGIALGTTVTLRGTVARTKVPELFGIELPHEASDYADQELEVTGVLDSYTIPEDVDSDGLHRAHKSPGAHYILRTAVLQRVP